MKRLEDLSDAELQKIAVGDLDSLSNEALEIVAASDGGQRNNLGQKETFGSKIKKSGQAIKSAGQEAKMALLRGPAQMARGVGKNFSGQSPEGRGEELGSMLPGAMKMGAALGIGSATAGMGAIPAIAATGLGSAGIEAYSQLANRAFGGQAPETSGEAFGAALKAGAKGATAEGAFRGAGAGLKMMAPKMVNAGAQLLNLAPGVTEKYGRKALENLDNLANAPDKKTVQQGYQAFERYTGLKSLRNAGAERGELLLSNSRAEKLVNSAFQKISNGQPVDPQELYEASQAGRFLKDQAKFGDSRQLANLSNVQRAKVAVDDALEKIYPEYKFLRSDAFMNKMAEQFNSVFPLNKNQSPNKLKFWSSILAALGGAGTGNPALIAAPIVTSPAIAGLGIRGASLAKKAAGPAAQLIRKAAPSLIGSGKIEDVLK